jgi:thioredoxin 1
MTDIIPSLELESLVRGETRPVLIDLYADWCGPCQMLAPLIDQLATALADHVRVVKMNIDNKEPLPTGGANPLANLMAVTGIRSIPTLVLFENGQFIDSYQDEKTAAKITEWMEKALGRKLSEPSVAPALHDYAMVFKNLTGTLDDKVASVTSFFNQNASRELHDVFAAQCARAVGFSHPEGDEDSFSLIFRTTEDIAREIARIVPDKPVTGPILLPPK